MTSGGFRSDADFRRALEARLANTARANGRGLVRERQVCIFERFLARTTHTDAHLVIKGGMALELRTARARSTRDIDLRAMGDVAQFERQLHELADMELGDYLRFRVGAHAKPDIESAGMKYPGRRYRVQAQLASKIYGDPFGVDVAFGEPIFGTPDRIRGRSDLSFIGVAPPELAIPPRETHIAEKLHAYTLPRATPNSRVRDLPDIAILATVGTLEAESVRQALEQTFAHRATHTLPPTLEAAPERWRGPYGELAVSNRLPWPDLEQVHAAARAFLDPVLGGALGSWDPHSWEWHTPS
jgi:Nucleotidyl transferase AbiEii toxin, Type IV TA system